MLWLQRVEKWILHFTDELYDDTNVISGYADFDDDDTYDEYKVSGAVKGDQVVVKVENKKFTVSIGKQKVNTSVKAILQNKFGQEMDNYKDKIYLMNSFNIGMTRKQMRSTTWGKPDKINYYYSGRMEQWVYYNGDDTLYIYFVDGKLSSWQRY